MTPAPAAGCSQCRTTAALGLGKSAHWRPNLYRDDTCAVCGESLPPDHFYCREHSVTVDDRLHEIGALLSRVAGDLPRLAVLLTQVAPETWDYLAEDAAGEPEWPPRSALQVRAHPDDVDVDVDTEPGQVRVRLDMTVPQLAAAMSAALSTPELSPFVAACRAAEGANATH